VEEREGGRGKAPGKRRRRWKKKRKRCQGERQNRERRKGNRLPKDLSAILENCKDLSVKHKFLINLKL
jgi:hypothetical protein